MIPDPSARYLTSRHGEATGFVVGLDLGQVRDHSAVVINEKRMLGWRDEPTHVIRFVHRFRLGVKYHDVAREVADLIAQLPRLPDPPMLYADSTGVGRPVCDLLREEGLTPFDVTLTAGANWSISGRSISLPKSLLASTLNVAFQNGTLRIAAGLPFRAQLERELGAFRVTTSAAGNDSFNSRTEADHDDLVIAMGLAVWGASRNIRPRRTVLL